jgi:hypothetical protein
MAPISALPDAPVILLAVLNPFAWQNRYNRTLDHLLGMPIPHTHELKDARGGYVAAVGVVPREVRRVAVCRLIAVEADPSRGDRGKR